MKRILFALLVVLASCDGKEPNTPPAAKESITISPSKNFTLSENGETVRLSIDATADWTSGSSAGWLTLAPDSGSKGKGEALLTVKANSTYEKRAGTIVFNCGGVIDTVYVTQNAAALLSADPNSFTVGHAGGTYLSKIQSNEQYEMTIDEQTSSWVTADLPGTKALDTRTLTVVVAPNEDVHGRSGKIGFTSATQTAEIVITQKGKDPVFTVTASNRNCPASGDSFSVPVNTNLELTVDVPSWITCSRTAEGYDFSVSANEGDNLRTGTVTISNKEFGKSASFTVNQKSPKSLYILAIGNSFSWDAMEYLYQILQELGYKDIFLGNLYIGGCTLSTHASNLTNSSSAYDYRVNKNGSWSSTSGFVANKAIAERDWDYISMQQASGSSGLPETYEPYLSTVIDAVKRLCPSAKRMWHMTWAYQGNYTASQFSSYNYDQMTMYNAIVNCVKTKVQSRGDFDFVIPCGTAVQNLRTSFMGDNITRDGYHMSYREGRFVTGLMWARQITGKSIASVTYKPSSYSYSEEDVLAIKEAVETAYQNPLQITASSYPGLKVIDSDDPADILSGNGLSIDNYTELSLSITHYAYYNSTSGSALTSKAGGSPATKLNQFAATQIFEKNAIPNGSLIILKRGFQYRPEGWTSLSTKTSNRPGNVTTQLVEVTDSWWGSWNYRAFNLAKAGNPALDEAGQAELDNCFHIFIPK